MTDTLRDALDRLDAIQEAASQHDGHNELACHSIQDATDAALAVAAESDDCLLHALGTVGLLLPGVAIADTGEARWDLMNECLDLVLHALDHLADGEVTA